MKRVVEWFNDKFSKKQKIIIIISVVVIIVAIIVGVLLLSGGKEEVKSVIKKRVKKKEPVETVKIVDLESNSRPYAVMINNIGDARTVQSGLNKAYMVYEIIVEGGITRYLALFKDVDDATIGSIRSSRHYYLDYVLENDAIYVHWGWSPQAQEDIRTLGINNINGLTYEGKYFYRIKTIGAPHNGFTNMKMLTDATDKLKYRKTTDKGLLLNYSAKSVDLSSNASLIDANSIKLIYSNYLTTSYQYDEESKSYLRYVSGKEQIDHENEEKVFVKNILAYQVENYTIPGDHKNRQFLNNTGSGEGYYITEGKAIKITWEKKDRSSKTVYKDENGKEITVNDGNTYIQIVPKAGSITIE